MRSIHKKTLKRFLSTLLAVVMVLGMVPFTALAAPADVTLTDSTNGLTATITPTTDPTPANVVDGEYSTVTYAVMIAASNAIASGKAVNLKIGSTTTLDFGTITIDSGTFNISGTMPSGFSINSDGDIVGSIDVQYTYGAKTVNMTLNVDGTDTATGSTTFTINRLAKLDLTVPTTAVTAGEGFTVSTVSDIAEGYVKFTYGTDVQRVAVIPDENGKGIASATFTATGSGTQPVTALQYAMTDVVNTTATKNITVSAADTYWDVTFMVDGLQYGEKQSVKDGEKAIRPVDPLVADGKVFVGWYKEDTCTNVFDFAAETIGADITVYGKVLDKRTITFLPGAADAYIPFSPTTVSVEAGGSYTIPAAIPTREGYTFKGWDSDGNSATVEYSYTGSAYTPSAVTPTTADMTLNAVWEVEKVAIAWPATLPAGVTANSGASIAAVNKGSTVYFTLTVAADYDPSTMVVKAGDQALAPVMVSNNVYQYSFVANADTTVTITAPSKLTYTVMMPVGHFTAKITAANGTDITPAASASVEYGKGYTFTVTPDAGYAIAGVYVNGEKQTGSGPYTVTHVTSAQTVEVVVDAVPSYTVTYVVNDAQYTTQKVTSGEQIGTLPENPTVDGYTFNSWNTKQDGSGDAVTAATTVDSDMTVYAKLTANTYTITYNENGGSGAPTAGSKTHGTAVALSADVPTKAGHTFLGWGTTAAATTATYQPGDMYSTDADVTLYAVWQIKTFTVTLPNGTGYTAMPATNSSSPVNYDGSFTFTVTVDPEYAVAEPEVKVNGGAALTNPTPTPNADGSKTYTYTISNIQENKVVSVSVTKNSVYTVTFMVNGSVYQTQQVEHGAKATVPNPPSVEGYTFDGWYSDTDCTTAFVFTNSITADTTVYGKMTAITPKVTYPASGTGWTLGVTTPTGLSSGDTVAYKSSVEFTVTISTGYDATNLAVAANGLALAPVEVNGNTYKFVLSNITADQKITVTGVARKMITITYNDNGGIGGPGQEQVKYYLSDTDCDKISLVEPTRVGYTFLGWATTNDAAAAAYSNPVKYDGSTPLTSDIANFTTDTTLYAVWSAKTTTVTLTVDKTSQYEGEKVVLTADVKSGTAAVTSGSVQFYRANNSSAAELVGTAKVSGGKAVLTIATSAYKRGEANTDSYTVKFIPDEGSGYSEATSSPAVTVTVLSTAISWKLNTSSEVDTKANVLTIKDSSDTEVDSMTAGQEYTLELPKIYALDNQATALVVNKDYKVTWQFCNASGTWEDYTAAAGTNSVKILAEYSQYVFRAVVTPLTGATGHFTQAAKYNAATTTTPATLIANQYEAYLVTEATSPVAQQATATSLAVTDTHDLTDGTVAEFEGQEVTLTATVTLTGSSTTKVTTGEVYFYKAYNYTSNTGTLIGKANVQSDGTAVLEAEMSTYVAGTSDVFTAVYQSNPTYATSVSSKTVGGDKVGESVLIRSTAIAWAKDTSGAEVKTLTVTPTGDIYADNQYTLTLPAIKEEGQDVTLTVGTDYVVSWYMVKADKTVVLLAENTESNTYTVVPPTAGVTYYAVVSPKAGSNYTDAYEDSTTKNFLTSEKTAASVQSPTITTITFGEVLTDTGKTPDFSQYEEKTITITAKVVEADLTTPANAKDPEEVVKSGTVTFYVVTKSDGTYEKIGTATVSNGLATVSYTLPEFALNDGLSNIEYFFAVYSDTAGTYADSNTTEDGTVGTTVAYTNVNADTEAVQILSTTISWKIDSTNKIVADPDANKLKVYIADANGNKGALVTDGKMTAGSSYVLELPAVYALDDAKNATPTALTVNKDYIVVWQYREFGASEWQGYPNGLSSDTALITPTYSGYQFQAIVTPIYDNEHLTGYKTAAAYDSSDVATGKTSFLVTDPTEKTELQKTTTTLAITGAVEEAANQVLFGATKFGWGNHLVQYENQTVTLKATVTDNATDLGVNSVGKVYFYRYTNDGVDNNDVLLNANGQGIEVGPDGIATMNYTMPDYDSTKAASDEENCSRIYAVYVEGVTYDTSASVSFTTGALGVKTYAKPSNGLKNMVFSMSTSIKTPIIDSVGTAAPTGKLNGTDATYTSYEYDLTGLLAGVSHTFTLRTGNAAADWSVVALDGREVASSNYDIQWLVTTGSNEEQAPNDATQASFVVNESKNGDKYRVKLIHKGDMTADAFSNYVVINSLQNVTVEVTASDEIDSTPGVTDVYQLNNITLTAEVKGKESQIMKPTGNVTFYYSVDNTNWVEIGTAALALDEVSGTKKATIVTDKLPVNASTYTKQDVKITAVYAGDETFQKSGEFNTTTKEITDTVAGAVTDETVTVYSSVVFVSGTDENRAVISTNLTTDGIHIVATGDLKANETGVVLTLQDIYTLDHPINLSKLVYGKDYTVEWQILENASQYNVSGYYGNTVNWADTGVTLKNYTISSVPQDAAYRAKITVTDTAPVQGSARGVLQDDADDMTTGRKVYYSNVLVVGAGQATVTTNITTSANKNFNEEGIVEGETVTIHALVAGAAKVTPISKLTATIVPQGGTQPVFTDEKDNVNGYNAFTWDTTNVTPGYYTLTVVATSNNGYAPQTITRTLIVRDNNYTLTVTDNSKVYNGKAQGIEWTLDGVDIENTLAQNSVVVYYKQGDKLVEPTQAGEYTYELYLPASAYWTELTHVTGTFTIEKRDVSVVDLVAQAKVYDGTPNVNIQEIILEDAATDQGTTGLPTGTTGVINGDSVYATVENLNVKLNSENAGANAIEFTIKSDVLKGDDAGNYKLVADTYTGEAINVQRSQVKGDIANSTFQYTGSNITVPADDIYLIDQAGNVLTPADYTVTYYYHNGDGVEKVDAMNKLGKYTVIARPEQDNYKGGASETVYVVSGTGVPGTLTTYTSALIDITNTVELFGAAGNTGIVATATNGATITTIEYQNGTGWTGTAPTAAGRYLVKVTASTGDTAYGIYTIVKARPELTLTATGATYTSGQITGTPVLTGAPTGAEVYYTWTGGTIQGIAYEAPTEVGSYVVTAHIGETDNYTAHEVSANFAITKKALTITADSLQRWQYGSYPDMVATFEGLATGGVAADTSLRDVQIQPEFIFNDLNGDGQPEYTNSALDQVGKDYPITVRNALARNYEVSYVEGNYFVTEEEPKADLAIHGMIDNGLTSTQNIAYYGDQIQLYAYGNYKSNGNGTGVYNPSSLLEWSLSTGAPATIDQDGLLTIKGVGTFTVTLTRGSGTAAISTSIDIKALPKEVVVNVPDVDKVYNALEQTYNGTVTVEGLIGTDTVTPDVVAGDKRTNVGSQITQYKVNSSTTVPYVSEVYGGLFTINDKEVTVKPTAKTTTYGTPVTGLTYTVKDKDDNTVAGVLSNDNAVSVADQYGNLDVGTYEILVAGAEDMNYNVKYLTNPGADKVTVDPLALTVSTGTLDANVGMTSGSLNPNGKFPVNGAEVNASAALGAANVRMYGEPNWVMDYDLATLISGDSLADLDLNLEVAPLGSTLVDFNYSIVADANVEYEDKTTKLKENNGAGSNDLPDYVVETSNSMIVFGNYNESYNKGTQNIYQRPVTLKLRDGMTQLTAYQPSILNSDNTIKADKLLELIINNLVVEKYSNGGTLEGGLAELLNHTIVNLQISIKSASYDSASKTITAVIQLGNQNYWMNAANELTITVKVDPTKVYAEYGTLGWTSATVTMKQLNEDNTITYANLGNSTVWYYIYKKDATLADADQKYSSYKDREYERKVQMTYSGSNGLYIANYDRLSAGDYVMFAIVEGYTIIE